MGAAAWFTRRLEAICDVLDLSAGILSMLGALGANIPNYSASIVAIASGQLGVGLGIIIGSNIYNIAIILGIATFATRARSGIMLQAGERQDVRTVAHYAVWTMLATLLTIWLLPGTPLTGGSRSFQLLTLFCIGAALLVLGIFGSLAWHLVKRSHPPHTEASVVLPEKKQIPTTTSSMSLPRLITEMLVALLFALGGVVVMVQSGQTLTMDLHIPQVLAGLLILAVATSLPNTVVAVSLVRTSRAAACVEEIFSSNSINAALGIALPLLFWREALSNRLLLWLDAPLMVMLTVGGLLYVLRGRISRVGGIGLLLSYVVWVGVHVWVQG